MNENDAAVDRWENEGGRTLTERWTGMNKPLHEAIEQLVEEYQQWLEESPDNVAKEWLRFMDEPAEAVDDGEEWVLRMN